MPGPAAPDAAPLMTESEARQMGTPSLCQPSLCGPQSTPFITQAAPPSVRRTRAAADAETQQAAKRQRLETTPVCSTQERGQAQVHEHAPGELGASAAVQEQQPQGVLGAVFSPLFSLLQHQAGDDSKDSTIQAEASSDAATDSHETALAALPHSHQHTHVPEAVEHELPPDAGAQEVDDDEYFDFDPLLFIGSLPALDKVVPRYRQPILPAKTRQCKSKTLVLDLDETLVHSSLEAVPSSDFTFPVHFNNQEHTIHVKQRPGLHTFLQRVSELFEVVVFTASQKIYAERLLNIIDPHRKYIKHRIFRESCVIVDGNYLKDLTVLGRDLSATAIIDNSPQAFGFQVDNGIPIESWYDDMADGELLRLLPFLESLVDVEDVRPAIASKFRLRELIAKTVLSPVGAAQLAMTARC